MPQIAKSKNGEYLNVGDPEFEESDELSCGCVNRCKCDDGDEE